MTLDEIKQELQDIKAELARLEGEVNAATPGAGDPKPDAIPEKPDDVMEGPNEWGAVKLRAVEEVKPGTWVLWAPTVKKFKLNEQQLTCVTLNCGYDVDSDSFVPAAFYFVPAHGYGPEAEKISGMAHQSVFKKQLPLPWVKPRWTLDMEKMFYDTIAVRTKDATEIAKGLKAIQKDGKA